jgi:hypothetical protein
MLPRFSFFPCVVCLQDQITDDTMTSRGETIRHGEPFCFSFRFLLENIRDRSLILFI